MCTLFRWYRFQGFSLLPYPETTTLQRVPESSLLGALSMRDGLNELHTSYSCDTKDFCGLRVKYPLVLPCTPCSPS
jgi:hypothetical protein